MEKNATIKMIAKPGKDNGIVKNYRPISLLPFMGKVFERIFAHRLSNNNNNNNEISGQSVGY